MSHRDPVVSTAWLAERLSDPSVRILDASMHLAIAGTPKRDAKAEFVEAHIPGAVFFDIDAVADRSSALPHMLPSPDAFSAAVGALGIGSADTVVVYDSLGLYSAARVWWTFRVFGHGQVFVLDGGLPAWRAEGRPVETGPAPTPEPRPFRAAYDPSLVRDLNDVRANIDVGAEQLLDARSAGRFAGTAPEPRPGLRGGHVPGSLNLPFTDIVGPDGRLLPASMLADRFRSAGVDLDRPVVTTCGSGVTASVLALGLFRLGRADVPVYDGSWSEWGGRDDVPVATGPAMGAGA